MTAYWRTSGVVLVMLLAMPVAAENAFHRQVNDALARYVAGLTERADGMRLDTHWQPVDPRLTLTPCDTPPTVEPLGSRLLGRTTLRVRCGTPPWSLMVPLTVRGFRTVVVNRHALERGQAIDASQLALEERELTASTAGYFTDPGALTGYRAKRSLAAGQLLTAAALMAPRLVTKGQSVIIEAGSEQFTVRSEGSALTDGSLGDTIRVRNSASGRVIEGTVSGEGKVRVPL